MPISSIPVVSVSIWYLPFGVYKVLVLKVKIEAGEGEGKRFQVGLL
jgi:hypothetical protein